MSSVIILKIFHTPTPKSFMKDERKKDMHIMGRLKGRLGRTWREAWADY